MFLKKRTLIDALSVVQILEILTSSINFLSEDPESVGLSRYYPNDFGANRKEEMMAIEWGAVLGSLKMIKDLADKYQDPKFNEAYIDLQSKIMEIQQDHIRLANENEKMMKAQDLSDRVSFNRPYVYFEGDSEPHCQVCWEKDNNLIHVGEREEWDEDEIGRMCPACKHVGHEKWPD